MTAWIVHASAASEASFSSPHATSLRTIRLTLDFSRCRISASCTEVSGPRAPTSRMVEVAEAVVWLASDAASYVVGHVLVADGGFLAS
jgi:NAD(P)-dependent dehydrogenase (short-subunit alcohol dehydrogenase family)